MLVAFQERFEDQVASGQKTQTIRPRRRDGRHAHVGEVLHCYSRMRRRHEKARLLGRFRCEFSKPIRLGEWGAEIDGRALSRGELEALAARDGFASFEDLLGWFVENHTLPFEGRIYRWGYEIQG